MFKKIIFIAVLAALTLLTWPAKRALFVKPAAISAKKRAEMLAQPALHAENYKLDPSSSLESRMGPPPDFLLEWLRKYDGVPGYKSYAPSPEQKKLTAGFLEKLPSKMRAAFKERLLGIYFVENFTGNGMSDLALGSGGKKYAWMVVNPAGFSKSLSQTLTAREDSVFRSSGTVSVTCGKPLPGVYYSIAHEGTHVYDYVEGITPFVEPDWYELLNGSPPPRYRPWAVWRGYDLPAGKFDFKLRHNLRFFGLEGGPRLEASDAKKLYKQLNGSPFTSLYGSQNWAEDTAELLVYAVLKRETGEPPCKVIYPDGAGGVRFFVPGKLADLRAEYLYDKLSR